MTYLELEQYLEGKYGYITRLTKDIYRLGNEHEVEYSQEIICIYKVTSGKKELVETYDPANIRFGIGLGEWGFKPNF